MFESGESKHYGGLKLVNPAGGPTSNTILKLKCKSSETETTNAVEDKINVNGKTCSLFSIFENVPSRKPQ